MQSGYIGIVRWDIIHSNRRRYHCNDISTGIWTLDYSSEFNDFSRSISGDKMSKRENSIRGNRTVEFLKIVKCNFKLRKSQI